MKRNPTREVRIGTVALGATHPVAVQSMCATRTQDVDATVEQAEAIRKAGGDLVRVAVDGAKDVAALAENLVVLHKGRVERTVDLKGHPYRDEQGIPVRGVIRQLLMETSVETNGTQAIPPLRAVR